MRIVSAAVVAALLAASTLGAAAIPSASTGLKAQSTFELIKSKKKAMKKAKGKHKGHKGGKGPGKCGVGKYYKHGKCNSADAPKKA